jgi:chromosomal replication initiation ATPase DnaA
MGADLFVPSHLDVNSLWCGLADHLRARLGTQQFAVWFGTASAVSLAPGRLAVALPNEFTRRWVPSHFDDELRRWAESTGVSAVELVVDTSLGSRALTEPDVVAPARPSRRIRPA